MLNGMSSNDFFLFYMSYIDTAADSLEALFRILENHKSSFSRIQEQVMVELRI
jgi:hypothetical protein